ncbi:Trm112 family protein [Streptomyces cucumeris]|uniref:Trm112 family protein n=1 Tax=Streptomyces TaxID=1883 RepID=UPI003D717F77
MPLEAGLLEILACPACHAPLREEQTPENPELVCTGEGCALAYPVRDGIPVLLVDEARRPA